MAASISRMVGIKQIAAEKTLFHRRDTEDAEKKQ
jgi:hypothetical protein